MVLGVDNLVLSKTSMTSSGKKTPTSISSDALLNLARGDPTLYEPYWKSLGDRCATVVSGSDFMSYFVNPGNLCWFMIPELDSAIRKLHGVVGNAVADDDRYIVVGTGSTQLFHALLYALSDPNQHQAMNVVAAAPFYSSYPEETDFLRSRLYKWAGDANSYNKDEPYIEVVTSPNNPDGTIREAVVNRENGVVIYDLAYYWPHFTPITIKADYDVMLFTFSKATGHAGSRIGWAIVKDKSVATKMVKFIEHSSIGISRESQLRASKILGVLIDEHQTQPYKEDNFFKHAHHIMSERWKRLWEAVQQSGVFFMSNYPQSYCNFFKKSDTSTPAFAWLKRKDSLNCDDLWKKHKIVSIGGTGFGVGPEYTRVSMLSPDQEFNLFLERLSAIKETYNNGTNGPTETEFDDHWQ